MDNFELRKKRALYRSWHRGTKELDIILGRFAETSLEKMDDNRLSMFEDLLALQDPDIDQWIKHGHAPENVDPIVIEIRTLIGLA